MCRDVQNVRQIVFYKISKREKCWNKISDKKNADKGRKLQKIKLIVIEGVLMDEN